MDIVAVLLAGGKSRRMGQDKSQMFGGIPRIRDILQEVGIQRSIVLCGSEERCSLFDGEVWPDPPQVHGLHELIQWVRLRVEASILFLPCDAFLLDADALRHFLERANQGGVPTDSSSQRQLLFAYLPRHLQLPEVVHCVEDLFAELPSIDLAEYAVAFTNFNSQDDVSAHRP